jgi:two-component system heavy metal sensor histidine kinase CusS
MRSFYAKVFLMFVGSMLILHTFNQGMILLLRNPEVRKIFHERQIEQNLQWNSRGSLSTDADELKRELLGTMRGAHPDEVMVFTQSLDQLPTDRSDQFPLPAAISGGRVNLGPADKYFPLMSHAMVDIDDTHWEATRLISSDQIVVSLVNQSANDRSVEEFLNFRSRMVRQIAPLSLLLAIVCALLLSRRVLAPIKRVQNSLRSLDNRDLSVRIPSRGEDNEFRDFIASCNGMLERLEKGFQQMSRFSSDAAHELRTPLTIMQGYTERAINESVPGSQSQIQLRMICDEIERLTSITHKLLLLAQADAGRLRMDFEVVNVSNMLDEMRSDVAMIEPSLDLRGNVEKQLIVLTDRALLQQLFNNLFSNAVKYNETDKWIDISAWSEAEQLHVLFSNPSHPIDQAFESIVFDRFSRADISRSRQVDGIGLGLSLCKEIALANGGTLEFRVLRHTQVVVEFCMPIHR